MQLQRSKNKPYKHRQCIKQMYCTVTTIPILIADMRNDMCHINNASKLRSWYGWNDRNDDYPDYPEDYFDNPSKYIIDVTKDISFPKKVSFQYIYVRHK